MFSAGVELIAVELDRYGETEAADWILTCTDEELVRVCSVAEWLLARGPRTPSGSSMTYGKASALSAVYVKEGRPRDLARKRRGPGAGRKVTGDGGREPDYQLQKAKPRFYGVHDDAISFWGGAAVAGPHKQCE